MNSSSDISGLPLVLTVQEVAELLRCNAKTVYAAIEERQLPARKVGRRIVVYRDALLAWLSCKDCVSAQRRG
ncbi:MAG: helix-turn-helix domain-containing protein [Deltaproteobacteria bacterium]|nr:helix-turn-helix domain-containing protein [Deltaproteobacteria bacterium]